MVRLPDPSQARRRYCSCLGRRDSTAAVARGAKFRQPVPAAQKASMLFVRGCIVAGVSGHSLAIVASITGWSVQLASCKTLGGAARPKGITTAAQREQHATMMGPRASVRDEFVRSRGWQCAGRQLHSDWQSLGGSKWAVVGQPITDTATSRSGHIEGEVHVWFVFT